MMRCSILDRLFNVGRCQVWLALRFGLQLSGGAISSSAMENETLRSRVALLVQKSRKALRLYSTMGRVNGAEPSEFAELQVGQWREVNADLLRELSAAVDNPNTRALTGAILALRDRFYGDWRRVESDLRVKQQELIAVSEHGDFIKAAHLSRELVVLKAREQAAQAAHHELQDVVKRSRLSHPTIELSNDDALRDDQDQSDAPDLFAGQPIRVGAKIIPLRK